MEFPTLGVGATQMKHIRSISKPVSAQAFGLGQYILVAGQVIGILALIFVDKEAQQDEEEEK
jgi:hypothetical protein